MNIYEKVLNITDEIQKANIKKSGRNSYTNFKYFELTDLSPIINNLCLKYKIIPIIKYDKEIAKMYIINAENPEEQIEYTSPMGSVNLKGAHEIQNIGAVQTYLRRYLFLTAFNIAEHDELDYVQGDPKYEKNRLINEISKLYIEFTDGQENQVETVKNKLSQKNIDQLRVKKQELITAMKNKSAWFRQNDNDLLTDLYRFFLLIPSQKHFQKNPLLHIYQLYLFFQNLKI